MPDPSDEDLVLRTRRGDSDAYGELVRRYQASVFNVCYRLAGERREAEDWAQEAFIRAYERLETFDSRLPFGPWIRRVAANWCLNRLARHRPPAVALDEERDRADPQAVDPAALSEQAERAAALRAALAALPPHYRVIIELRHFQELSYAEIAAALGLPLSDVKSHLFRARQLLARRFLPDG
jgi:RNA polymerase sigma-70 factor (ECF subfamily)